MQRPGLVRVNFLSCSEHPFIDDACARFLNSASSPQVQHTISPCAYVFESLSEDAATGQMKRRLVVLLEPQTTRNSSSSILPVSSSSSGYSSSSEQVRRRLTRVLQVSQLHTMRFAEASEARTIATDDITVPQRVTTSTGGCGTAACDSLVSRLVEQSAADELIPTLPLIMLLCITKNLPIIHFVEERGDEEKEEQDGVLNCVLVRYPYELPVRFPDAPAAWSLELQRLLLSDEIERLEQEQEQEQEDVEGGEAAAVAVAGARGKGAGEIDWQGGSGHATVASRSELVYRDMYGAAPSARDELGEQEADATVRASRVVPVLLEQKVGGDDDCTDSCSLCCSDAEQDTIDVLSQDKDSYDNSNNNNRASSAAVGRSSFFYQCAKDIRRGIRVAAPLARAHHQPTSELQRRKQRGDDGVDDAEPRRTAAATANRNDGDEATRLAQLIQTATLWWIITQYEPFPQNIIFPALRSRSYLDRVEQCAYNKVWRQALVKFDKSARAAAMEDIRTSETLNVVGLWLKERVYQTVGYVKDRFGASQEYRVDWTEVPRTPFGYRMKLAHFGLGKDVVMLNGAQGSVVPTLVRRARREWEHRIHIDPVVWRFKTQGTKLMQMVSKLAKRIRCNSDELSICSTKDEAAATVLRSMPWLPGDRFLVWEQPVAWPSLLSLVSHITAAHGVEVHILQNTLRPNFVSPHDLVAEFEQVLECYRPKSILLPHITELGQVLPLEHLSQSCASYGVIMIVDGTDAVGNLDFSISQIGADFYFARLDCYQFCVSGITALVARKERQGVVTPLTVSYRFGEGYSNEWTYTGLVDSSASISVAQAVQFQKYICAEAPSYCTQLAQEANKYLCDLWGVVPLLEGSQQQRASGSSTVSAAAAAAAAASLPTAHFSMAAEQQPQRAHGIVVVRVPRSEDASLTDAFHLQSVLMQVSIHVSIVRVPAYDPQAAAFAASKRSHSQKGTASESRPQTQQHRSSAECDFHDDDDDDVGVVVGGNGTSNDKMLPSCLGARITCQVYTCMADIRTLGEAVKTVQGC